jgi:hypothetical protein
MKKTMLIALSLLSSVAMAETKFNFSGDAYVRAYNINAHNVGSTTTQAFSQFFRLNVDAKPDEHLTIKTGLVLSGDNWEGDSHRVLTTTSTATGTTTGTAVGGTNDNGTGNGSIAHLDHAVLEYNNEGWITSVGRLAVSSPGNFLTSDDRRDRVQVLKVFPTYDMLAFVYDKRAAGSITDKKDDLDMYSINYYGSWNQFKYALQTGYWASKKYGATTSAYNGVVNLDDIKQVTPQLSTTVLGVNADLYYTILWGGSAYYKNDHHSMALKLSKDLEVVNVEYESILTRNGGLIAGGFDSLSSIVNNSMDHNVSQINLRNIGFGLGNKDADEYLHMVRVSKKVTNDLTASLSAGCGKFYVWSILNSYTPRIEKNTILDATVKYDFSKALALNAKFGKFLGDNKDHAGSLTLNANF